MNTKTRGVAILDKHGFRNNFTMKACQEPAFMCFSAYAGVFNQKSGDCEHVVGSCVL